MQHRLHLLPTLAVAVVANLALVTSAAAAGKVWVVDQNGGTGAFFSVSQAVGAATDGDTILVKDGFYNGVTINAKSLTILADGAAVDLGVVLAFGLGATQSLTVRGCNVGGLAFSGQLPFRIHSCQGAVVIEDAVISQFLGSPDQTDHAVSIVDSDRVELVRCQITAADGTSGSNGFYGSQGGAGVYVDNSSVGIYDCAVTGGDGGDAQQFLFTVTSTFAGAGLWVRDGVVVASGSSFQGGQGGDGDETGPGLCDLPSSNSGDGITMFPNGQVTRLDCTATGGAAPTDPAGCPTVGLPGVAIDTSLNGVLTVVNEPSRSLEISSPARSGQTATLTVEGVPGEATFLLFSATVHGALELGLAGALLPGPPLHVFGLAPLDGGGQLSATLPIPANALPPGIEAANVYLQVAVPGGSGTGILGSGTVVTLLASGF